MDASNVRDDVFYKIININTYYKAFFYYLTGSFLHVNFLMYYEEHAQSVTLYLYEEEITLKEYSFNSYMTLNDVVKINSQKFRFISTATSKEKLFILIAFNHF